MDLSIRWLAAVLLTSALIAGCACGQIGQPACPIIMVSNIPNRLTINGQHFSNIPNCAQLSLDGLPSPEAAVSIGQPLCSSGNFHNFIWQYSLSCQPSSSQNVVVVAVDQSTSTTASQAISLPWGPGCSLFGPACLVGEQSQSWCPSNECNDGSCQAGIITSCANPLQPTCTDGCANHGGVNPNLGCVQQ
jgi:hypothetical protein